MASDWYPVSGKNCHAMNKTRITEFSIETEETVVVRRPAMIPVWCPLCGSTVIAGRPETAAAAVGLSPREIYRRVESGAVHFQESADGRLLVCLDSLITQE